MRTAFGFLLIACAVALAQEPSYEFAIACEDYDAHLLCRDGGTISVSYAIFGRTQEHVCGTRRGNLDCVAATSMAVVQGLCDGNSMCVVPASSNLFGDPCSGTNKYVQVVYQCL